MPYPPFAQERPALLLNFLARARVDHGVIVRCNLIVKPLRCVSQQIPMFVNCTPLCRYISPNRRQRRIKAGASVDNQELGFAQASLDEIIENCPPRFSGFTPNVLYSQKHFLSVLTHAKHHQKRDRRGLAVKPNAHHGAVENHAYDRLVSKRTGIPCLPVTFDLPPDST